MTLKGEERTFARARDAIFASRELTYGQKIAQLRRLEVKHCRLLTKQPRLQLEIKRRIAETLLELTISRGSHVASCRARVKSLEKLGYTNIERKAYYHLIYARAALMQKHSRIALNTAKAMIVELKRSLQRRRSFLGRDLLRHFEQLMKHIGRG